MTGTNDRKLLPVGSLGHTLALTKLVELLLAEVSNILSDDHASASRQH